MTNFEIINTSDFALIKRHILNGDSNSLTLLDIDDTIITPKSNMFRPHSKHYHLIDKIKANLKDITNYAEILSNWRLSRKLILVNNNWPELVREMKFNKRKIYALTQMRSGKFGSIKSMEDWRYNELKSMGVNFIENFLGEDKIEVLPDVIAQEHPDLISPAVFYKGIFMTGIHSKGAVMRYILENYMPSKIFFVDDREDYVSDVGKVCQEFGVPYFGAIYRGIDLMKTRGADEVMEFQKTMLLDKAKWLEDEEAERALKDEE